jgi:hypothetical protein
MFTASLLEAAMQIRAYNQATKENQPNGSDTSPSPPWKNYPHNFRLASRDYIQEGGIFKTYSSAKVHKNHYIQ